MFDLFKKAQEFKMSRRSFIGWSSAIAATAAIPVSRGLVAKAEANIGMEDSGGEGVWKTAACWHNCGSRCLNKVLVKDGVVIRQKTDDTHPDSPDFPQQRGCLRGRSQRKQVFNADRLKYPMKRKNWEPGGGKKELRGKDQWVRISWDEALDHIVSETNRIKKKYGNESIYVSGGADIGKVFKTQGGCTESTGTISWGAWLYTYEMLGVGEGLYVNGINDRLDLRNSQLIVLWGANPAWSTMGSPTYNYLQAKKAGARFITIDPLYTDSASVFDADWVPIRPGTDDALALGMMYTLLDEDDPATNPLVKWDFLNKYTIGFDKDHMPEGADPKDNFKDYLLGTYDGQPKTPEWAAEICGVEPSRIRSLAREIGGTERVALLTGWAPARINNGEGWVQTFSTLGMMTGHMGSSGNMTGVSCWEYAGNNGPMLLKGGGAGLPSIDNPVDNLMNENEIWDAVLNGEFLQKGEGKRKVDIQFIYHNYNAHLQTRSSIGRGIEAHRKVEFVVTNAYALTTNAKYSDIVLPVATQWETEGAVKGGNREILINWSKIIDPLYESKTDIEIAKELLKKFGTNPDEVYPISEKQMYFNQLAGSEVVKENGVDYEPLCTITAQDIKEWGVEGTPQQGRIPLKEFVDTGIYQIPRKPGDNYGFIAYKDFIDNPEENPVSSESGKFEIYCRALNEASKTAFTEIPPIPKYMAKAEGYESTFENWETKKKGKYPYQVFNPHYLRRSHSTFDNVPQLREAWPNPVYISAQDAKKLGIKEGETVLMSNEHGKTIRPAKIVETLMPGTIALPHGAWVDIDEETGVDRGGADNMLVGFVPTGLGTSGYNTARCNLEKWDGEQLEDDAKWAQRIIKFD
ncbi:molybdopterin-dependent oxidoreductase [Robertmurraya andreesenii]|uniref:Anaerobic dimethyl sulfoxide reductase subunit A n=1 Tax=Anoxybacillus andreesenii TaxID=1325932 RepID=A0ABT9V379_9BACL|nr:molybdopterin-dependent oxidoreductase [Robertmurraya andreesenii]MDQ0155413.1 anaerobic dimethyl sulfoxide reductase subunit A [Robertmurraya andreesenii]